MHSSIFSPKVTPRAELYPHSVHTLWSEWFNIEWIGEAAPDKNGYWQHQLSQWMNAPATADPKSAINLLWDIIPDYFIIPTMLIVKGLRELSINMDSQHCHNVYWRSGLSTQSSLQLTPLPTIDISANLVSVMKCVTYHHSRHMEKLLVPAKNCHLDQEAVVSWKHPWKTISLMNEALYFISIAVK